MLPASAPDLASLDLFLSTVRLGSLSRAAAAHGISQPSASARIRRLEASLGLPLLTRSPTGTRPTEAGVEVAEWAEVVVEAARGLMERARVLGQQSDSSLTVAASYTVAEYLVPGWLARLRRSRPASVVELEVVNSTTVLERVQSGTATIGFVESPGRLGGLSTRQVGRDELVLVTGPGHPWARRRTPLPAHLLVETAILVREHGSGTREVFEEALRSVGLSVPEAALELGSTSAVKAAAADGAAPAVLSRLAVETDVEAGRLVLVPVDGLDLSRPLRAVWHPSRPLSPLAEQLLAITGA